MGERVTCDNLIRCLSAHMSRCYWDFLSKVLKNLQFMWEVELYNTFCCCQLDWRDLFIRKQRWKNKLEWVKRIRRPRHQPIAHNDDELFFRHFVHICVLLASINQHWSFLWFSWVAWSLMWSRIRTRELKLIEFIKIRQGVGNWWSSNASHDRYDDRCWTI